MHVLLIAAVALLVGPPEPAPTPDLAFKPAGEGFFTFDTGVVKGKLQADDKSQGIPTFIDVKTGTDLAHGGGNPGLLSYYRLMSTGARWGHTARPWPKTTKLLPDGAAQIHWPPGGDNPVAMTATYRWQSADTLDLETTIKPGRDLPRFEVFLSSYFNQNFRSLVYLASGRHARTGPGFVCPQVNPLIEGTYLAFPRDWRAAQMFYDGRWEQGSNPVHFSVTRFLAAPLALEHDPRTGITFVVMAPPQGCFAVETPYHKDPPDGVAGHYSLYLSLFGEDLKAGQTARTHVRLVVGRNISHQQAVERYQAFIKGCGEKK